MINFQTPPTQKTERIFIQENDSYSNLQKLKTQISNKKKNQDDFEIMQDELSRLETRMKTLTAEKYQEEKEQRYKLDGASKTISDIKSQLDDLQIQLRTQKIQKQETEGENISLQQVIEGRNLELARTKAENKCLREKNLKLKNQLKTLDNKNMSLKSENETLEASFKVTLKEFENSEENKINAEKALKETDFEVKRNENVNSQNHQSNKKLDLETRKKSNLIEEAEKEIFDIRNLISRLDEEISNKETQNERIKTDIVVLNKKLQKERGREIDLQTELINSENLIEKKYQELKELEASIQNEEQQINEQVEKNEFLKSDLNALINHLNLIVSEKEKIVEELSEMNLEDENLAKTLQNNFDFCEQNLKELTQT